MNSPDPVSQTSFLAPTEPSGPRTSSVSALASEATVLGRLLQDPEVVVEAAGRLRGEMFSRRAHRVVFEAALELYERGEAIDVITVMNEVRSAGRAEAVDDGGYLETLLDAAPSSANLDYHLRRIQEAATLRDLVAAASQILRDIEEPGAEPALHILDRAEERISRFREERRETALVSIDRLLHSAMDRIGASHRAPDDGVTGIATGFPDLDRRTTGLHRGDLCIVAARPSMGKTSWVLNVAANVAVDSGRDVAIFSLEMPAVQLGLRLVCAEARLDVRKLTGGRLSLEDNARLAAASAHLHQAPIWIDDSAALDVLEIRGKSRRLQSQLKREGRELALIAVDYLQLLSGEDPRDGRVEQVSKISRGLKALARELSVPVIALSQLSRAPEKRQDRRPILSDLRDSGSIEQDADLVLFLFRPEYYERLEGSTEIQKGRAELIIGKQRNGPTGTVELFFHAPYMKFDSALRT